MRADAPPPPPGFNLEGVPPPPGFVEESEDDTPQGKPKRTATVPKIYHPSGAVHDGDTFGLSDGRNARLLGVDAFELSQTGRDANGSSVPLGAMGRDFLSTQAQPGSVATGSGTFSYGRPVVTLEADGQDVGRSILDQGLGVAAPDFLRNNPELLTQYMEAERAARLNRQGAFATQFQDPASFRKGAPDPWAQPEQSGDRKGVAYFPDDPTPFQGLRPEIASGYLALAKDPNSTADDLMSYASTNGFIIGRGDAEKFIKKRNDGAKVTDDLQYQAPPRLLTDAGDGATGAAMRGIGDPINMLDEIGAIVDTLGGTPGRENVWSSARRFGDILYNNIDQNRAILGFDEENHPYARFGGQVGSGLVIPGGSVEGVASQAFRKAVEEGATTFMAREAARKAVMQRLAAVGAGEGALAGAGAGEGGAVDRLPSTLLGAGIGAVAGPALGYLGGKAADAVRWGRKAFSRGGNSAEEAAADVVEQAGKAEVDNQRGAGEMPGSSPSGRAAAMEAEGMTPASITSADMPQGAVPIDAVEAPPAGFVLEDPALSRRPAPMSERPSPEAIADVARGTDPATLLPIPRNEIESLDEAMRANPGARELVQAPNEREALPSYQIEGKGPRRRDPLDLVGWLRTQGGIRESRGDLAHLGIDNTPRNIEFAKSEGFLGKLVRDDGMDIEDAAVRAWEQGWFPDMDAPPTAAEFMDALDATFKGGSGRVFHPDDYEALDAYRAAQRERNAVERAEQEGRPIVREVGEPVSMADLDANQPPATAYEDLKALGGKVGNIDVAKLGSKQDIARALRTVDNRMGGFDAARRGKMTHAETEALASELGMTADDLLKRRKGQALNAEQALAARSILAKSGDELVNLARKAVGGSEADLTAFREAWVRHAAIQEQVAGATAEAGRALSQFRKLASSKLPAGRVHQIAVEQSGGRDKLEDAARAILDLQDQGVSPGAINKFALKSLKAGPRDMAIEWYYNALLSNPPTHVVNTLSNTLTAALQIPEHVSAAALGKLRAGRDAKVDRVLGSEIGARVTGLLQGAREGMRAFARTARTGDVMDQVTKVEARTQEAIPGTLGKVIRTPTRLLAAEDELFKGIARRMELNGLAVRRATAEGLKGDALKRRIVELSANPTDDMQDNALDYARYLTFQRPLGPRLQMLSTIANQSLPLKVVIPFIRTPANILSYAAERSPAAPLVKRWREDMRAGGARRDLALSKVLLGTGLGMWVAQQAAEGNITGAAPRSRAQADLLKADGWQPYSIKVGDKYVSYSRMDPIATTLGTAADLAQAAKDAKGADAQKATDAFVTAIIDQVDSKTFLSGISDVMKALDPRGQGSISERMGNYAGRVAGSFAVPAIVAQGARSTDPIVRDPKGFGQQVQARMPGLSNDLPAKYDVWGRDIDRAEAVGPDMVSPYLGTTRKNDPINAMLLDLGVTIGRVGKEVGGQPITPEQQRQYQRLSGDILREQIGSAMIDEEWLSQPAEAKAKDIEGWKADARRQARDELFGALAD